jgi:hypothetical protein
MTLVIKKIQSFSNKCDDSKEFIDLVRDWQYNLSTSEHID